MELPAIPRPLLLSVADVRLGRGWPTLAFSTWGHDSANIQSC